MTTATHPLRSFWICWAGKRLGAYAVPGSSSTLGVAVRARVYSVR